MGEAAVCEVCGLEEPSLAVVAQHKVLKSGAVLHGGPPLGALVVSRPETEGILHA